MFYGTAELQIRETTMHRLLALTPLLLLACAAQQQATGGRPLPAQERFTGTWDNVDPATGGLKLMVSVEAGEFQIRAWGKCQPTDCDWGTVPLHLIGSSVEDQSFERAFATWDPEFATTHLMIHIDGEQLAVEIVTIFKDESGRSNFRRLFLLRRSHP